MYGVILAGGKGTRLYPYTTVLPKPLLPVKDKPILEHILIYLKEYGIKDIIISVGHLSQLIENFFQDGKKWGLNIEYSLEDKPLGTIAPLRLIKEKLTSTFLVINGDILTDLNLYDFIDFHQKNNFIATVATTEREVCIDFGVLDIVDNKIVKFEEKPTLKYSVSMGIYLFEPKIFDYIPERGPFGFDNLMYRLLDEKENVGAYKYSGIWWDLGRREDYEEINGKYFK